MAGRSKGEEEVAQERSGSAHRREGRGTGITAVREQRGKNYHVRAAVVGASTLRGAGGLAPGPPAPTAPTQEAEQVREESAS